MALTLREATPADAEAVLAHVSALSREPGVHVPLAPGEFQRGVAEERRVLQRYADSPNSAFFTAWEGSVLLGLLHLEGGRLPAGRHRACLGMSVERGARGHGLGRGLLSHALEWARGNAWLTRLELDVYARNAPALHLYESVGFAREARRRAAVRDGETLLDTYMMGLLFVDKRPRPHAPDEQDYAAPRPSPPGSQVGLRDATPADAEAVLGLWRALRRDPHLLVPTAGQRQVPCEDAFRQRYAATLDAENGHVVVAESAGTLVGIAEARGHARRAMGHEALVAIGVADGWRDRGIGGDLLRALEQRARHGGILRRLMLFVYTENQRAQHLYRRCGYEVEGRLRGAWWQQGRYHDELMMARLLDGD